MKILALALTLALGVPQTEPIVISPGDELTEGETRIYRGFSRCVKDLGLCRFDLSAAQEDLTKSNAQVDELLSKPPPPPQTRVPGLVWVGFSLAVVAAAIGGLVVGTKVGK